MTQDSHHMSPRKFGSRRWLIDDFAAPSTPKLTPQPAASQQRSAASQPHPQASEQANPQSPVAVVATPRRRFFRRPSLLVAMASVVFIAGMAATLWTLKTNSAVEKQVDALQTVQTDDEAPPATDKPTGDDIGGYTVAANMPRYLSIEKLGVKARVRTMGTTKSGAVQAPDNVHDVGWYSGSSLPGVLGGAAFMDGHVSSWETDGVFKKLPTLAVGDEITVEMGDGRVFAYRVAKTELAPAEKVDMAKALVPVTAGKGGLNLMTCHGKIKPGTDDFAERFMVYAEQIER